MYIRKGKINETIAATEQNRKKIIPWCPQYQCPCPQGELHPTPTSLGGPPRSLSRSLDLPCQPHLCAYSFHQYLLLKLAWRAGVPAGQLGFHRHICRGWHSQRRLWRRVAVGLPGPNDQRGLAGGRVQAWEPCGPWWGNLAS